MKHKLFKSHYFVAILMGVVVLGLLIITSADIGLTWDEPAYIAASESYMGWFDQLFENPKQALTEQAIAEAWQVNNEHPPLDKVWSGFIWTISRGFANDLLAHRLGNMLLVSVLAGLLFLLVADQFGMAAGLGAVAALLAMPRFFFHAHLAALDVPAAFTVFVVIFAFWKTLQRRHWAWGLLLGLLWGLALAVKINAVFIPLILGIWWLIFNRQWRIFLRFLIMGVTAFIVFIAVWPWLYFNLFERLGAYILFVTTEHWEIGQYYLHQWFMPPPWHFGFVMLYAVLPLSLTVLYLMGIVHAASDKMQRSFGWLLVINALVPILAIAIGQSMVYDNERLIMVSFPFLAALAGVGLGFLLKTWGSLAARWQKKLLKPLGTVALLLLAFLPQLVTMVRLYPHYLSYYGEAVGGLRGATRLGLETTYWCETYQLAIPFLNENANPGDKIWVDPYSHDVMIYYQKEGLLRDDIKIMVPWQAQSIFGEDVPQPFAAAMPLADWYVVHQRQSMLAPWQKEEIEQVLATKAIIFEYRFDDVPVLEIYQ